MLSNYKSRLLESQGEGLQLAVSVHGPAPAMSIRSNITYLRDYLISIGHTPEALVTVIEIHIKMPI